MLEREGVWAISVSRGFLIPMRRREHNPFDFFVTSASGFRGTPSQRFDSGAPALIVRQIHNFTQRGHMMLDAKGISDPTPGKGLALMTSLFMDENQISMLL